MDDPSTLCIPLKYLYLTKPVSSSTEQHNVLFEVDPSPKSNPIWREVDTKDTNGQFEQIIDDKLITDCLPTLRRVINDINNNVNHNEMDLKETDVDECSAILNEERVLENTLTITLTGTSQQVTKARARILRNYYQVERSHVGVDESIVFDTSFQNNQQQLNSKFCTQLNEISEYCGVYIALTDFVDSIPYGYPDQQNNNHSNNNSPYHVLIYGDQDCVSFATTKVKVLIDEMQGKFIDSISLELSLQPLVCGPKLGNLDNIRVQTDTEIYLCDWTPELFASRWIIDGQQSKDFLFSRNYNEVYITGNEANVILAKAMLKEILRKTKPVFKDCVIAHAKIDLINLRYQQKIKNIMKKYGSFIQLPYLGASRSLVRVQATTAPCVENTINKLMMLTADFYNSNYWIHIGKVNESNNTCIQPTIDTDLEFLDKITAASGATIFCRNNNSFDIIGYSSDTKRATSMIKSLPIWGNYSHQVRFRLELSIDQREFIAGKKNGKIIRIMNNTNVWVKFLPFNEYNFYVTLTADDYTAAAAGIQLLEDELPAEVSFFIPETYHKQVIGAGGLTIQSIMRKYNVFIKFSNDYDIQPNGFSHVRPDNVLIRCPAKNAKNIPAAKAELMDTVQERGQDHCNTFIHISRSHRRILLSEKCGFIREVESKTNTIILFPEKEPENIMENDLIEIRGLGNTSEDASRMVKALLPEDYVFKVAYSNKFEEVVNEHNREFYQKIIVPFRVALNIETQVFSQPQAQRRQQQPPQQVGDEEDQEESSSRYHQIVLSFAQEHSVGLEDVIQALTAFLRDKDLNIIDRGELRFDPVVAGSAAILGHKRKQAFFKAVGAGHSSNADDYPVSRPRYANNSPYMDEDYDDFYRRSKPISPTVSASQPLPARPPTSRYPQRPQSQDYDYMDRRQYSPTPLQPPPPSDWQQPPPPPPQQQQAPLRYDDRRYSQRPLSQGPPPQRRRYGDYGSYY